MMSSSPRRALPLFWLFWLAATAITLGCRKAPEPPSAQEASGPYLFEDDTDRLGLTFRHDPGPGGHYRMPRVMGSGGAFLDFDNDGRLDIYLVHNGGPDGKKYQLF